MKGGNRGNGVEAAVDEDVSVFVADGERDVVDDAAAEERAMGVVAKHERERPFARAADDRNHARVVGEVEHVLVELDGGDERIGALRRGREKRERTRR